jgi:quinol-cytochrome oxidoreductase complex cytochrome b subunit
MVATNSSQDFFKKLWPYLSTATITFLVLALISGTLLAANFTPTMDAYKATQAITDGVNYGWAIRGLHWWSSSLALICSMIFTTLAYWFGVFRGPAKWLWWSGLVLGLMLLGGNITGYYLPLDQNAYWRLAIEANLFNGVPVLGAAVKNFLLNGSGITALSIVRINWLHTIILPLFTVLALVSHVYAAKKSNLI